MDRWISEFDHALRTVAGVHEPRRPSPAAPVEERQTSAEDRLEAAALMRVNHVGEVCAQALYQGQRLVARDSRTRDALAQAAREEEDHLAWCAQRIDELGGRPSLLNPLWYAGSLALGVAGGLIGDRWNLAFLAETERQVEAHLEDHLSRLPAEDRRTRAVVDRMRDEEAKHRATAEALGAAALPPPVKTLMRVLSGVMTTISYRV